MESEKYKYFLSLIDRATCNRKKSAVTMSIKMSFQTGEITSDEQETLMNLLLTKRK